MREAATGGFNLDRRGRSSSTGPGDLRLEPVDDPRPAPAGWWWPSRPP